MLKPALLRTIYAAAREHKIDNEGLHETLKLGWNKTSLKDLTNAEACELLDGIRGKRPNSPGKRWAMGNHGRRGMEDVRVDPSYTVTPGERHILQTQCFLRNWDAVSLGKFVKRQLGKATIDSTADFNKVYWALKAMNRRDPASI